jgi:hypothetical protein
LVPVTLSLFSLLGISWQFSRYRHPRGAACEYCGITWTP